VDYGNSELLSPRCIRPLPDRTSSAPAPAPSSIAQAKSIGNVNSNSSPFAVGDVCEGFFSPQSGLGSALWLTFFHFSHPDFVISNDLLQPFGVKMESGIQQLY